MARYKLDAYMVVRNKEEYYCLVEVFVDATTEKKAIEKAKRLVKRDSYIVRSVSSPN